VDLAIEHSRGSDSALEADLWDELCRRLGRIGRDDLIAQQQTLARISGRSPKGGQRALNELLARTSPRTVGYTTAGCSDRDPRCLAGGCPSFRAGLEWSSAPRTSATSLRSS
jgi:hypothetical protein